jgi:hypothetical protein
MRLLRQPQQALGFGMSSSLTVGMANMFAEMTTAQISQNIQAKVMRSELQQAAALAQMLDEQSSMIQNMGYDRNGTVGSAALGSTVDRSA